MNNCIVIHGAGDLRIEGWESAKKPKPNEVCIAISKGGICGSDLHYFHNGGFGDVKLKQPMVLGHEVSGTILQVGKNVVDLKRGDKVAVNPSKPCRECQYCKAEMLNQCVDMRFNGSAMRFPHQQGLFRQEITTNREQVVKLSTAANLSFAACAEPLAVCLHAIKRASEQFLSQDLTGKRILISGAGPIGCLTSLLAKRSGATQVIVTDLFDEPLEVAMKMGADQVINIQNGMTELTALSVGKGTIDIVFECSGSPQAIESALKLVKANGSIVTIGMGGDVSIPLSVVVAKEVKIIGSFRFDEEFDQACELINRNELDLTAFITDIYPVSQAQNAFEHSADRSQSMKVQIDFDGK